MAINVQAHALIHVFHQFDQRVIHWAAHVHHAHIAVILIQLNTGISYSNTCHHHPHGHQYTSYDHWHQEDHPAHHHTNRAFTVPHNGVFEKVHQDVK